jgi:O-methyltransferase
MLSKSKTWVKHRLSRALGLPQLHGHLCRIEQSLPELSHKIVTIEEGLHRVTDKLARSASTAPVPPPPVSVPTAGDPASEYFIKFPPYNPDFQPLLLAHYDPVRALTIALALERIKKERINGSLAEVGVFQGNLSRLLHLLAPDRTLYLFDTFEGFPEQDLESFQTGDKRFSETSLELVKKNIGDLTNVVIKQGYFPDTAAGLEQEQFCFVMLDVDLLKPTVAGLNYFYPRLVSGGYMFLHDYNSLESKRAVSRALDAFMADKPERLVDIPDAWGTVFFRKH